MGNHTVNEVTNFFERGSDVEDDINTLASTNTHITENNQSVLVSSTSDTFLVPPLPPHNLGHDKSLSSSSISTPNVDNINTKRYTDSVMLRSDHKESSQVITSAIDAQVKSINEMLSYFSKLVKAEKTVQQALSDLLDDQMGSSTVGGYMLSLKAYEKKYFKYIGQLSNIQSKLTNLCDKLIDSLMNNLEYSTKKLHLLHNEYCLALITANHYQQWLYTHLRPCLLKGVERTMQLASEVVWHLLVFGGENINHFQSNWLKEFQSELDLTSLLEQNGVQFPGPVYHTFNQALNNNTTINGNLSPGSLIVNDLTGQSLIELTQLHKNKELLHRETVNQMTKECLQWEEALSQWRAVFANPGPNPWSSNLFNIHSSSVSPIVNTPQDNNSNGFHNVDNSSHLALPDIQDLWHDDRARPVNLCEVSFRLAICEFELCFANCLADSEAQLVNVLTDAQCRLNWLSLKLLTNDPTTGYPNTPATFLRDSCDVTTNNTTNGNNNNNSDDIDMQNGTDDNCSQALNGHDNSIPICNLSDSYSTDLPKLLTEPISNSPFALSLSNTSDMSSSIEQQLQLQQQQQRPERNRLWQSVRQSMSKFRSHFIRNNNIRSSTSSIPNTRTYQCMDTPFYHQNKKFNQQNHIQSNRESQDSSSILTSFPIVNECDVDINKEPWFHGVLPRAEVERLLQNQGDFLVRQTSKRSSGRDTLAHWNGTNGDLINGSHNETILNKDHNIDGTVLRMVLSVFWHGHRHFIVYGGPESGEGWHLEDGHFSTVRELVEYHMKTQTPVTAKSGACLITPISRPDWELDNRDVQLLQKIGQGNFGDVYRGVYNGNEVAVKTCRVDMTASDLRRKFLQGETTALNFNHPNIVKLIGIAVQSYPIMIVMEYVPGGSLLNHLRKSKNALPVMKLLQMSLDAANGMMYLEAKNCIHRLPAPDLMPVWLRTLMNHCWHDEPMNRPSFIKISNEIQIPNVNSFTPNLNRSIDHSKHCQLKISNHENNTSTIPLHLSIPIKDRRTRED
uniref:Tyrosine-protein kinase n=1 Tax=Schistosoma haematobium TaxID=6185 RepID=A0A094ZJF5_SCHHA